uniref:Uncharacterized protein n=1 Tax=Strigamia maritima TaxID=126957 RepID=T1JLQ5_STRMM
MKFILEQPSLQHITLVKSAISLWQFYSDIYTDWKCISTYKEDWKDIQAKVCEKVDILILPQTLKPLLKTFVRHIGLELRDWLKYLHTQNPFVPIGQKIGVVKCINLTRWTAYGKVDVAKTAETFVQLKELKLRDRYGIACMFCVANSVEDIWPQLMKDFTWSLTTAMDLKNKHPIFNFWEYVISRKIDPRKMNASLKSILFLKAIDDRNESAVKYFWSIFSEDERTAFLTKSFRPGSEFRCLVEQTAINHDKHGNGIIYFLLSQMNDEQLDVVLFSSIRLSFFHFLLSDLVYVNFLISSVDRVLYSLSKDVYDLLYLIAQYTGNSETVVNCFTHLWRNLDGDIKKRILSDDTELALFCVQLCKGQDLFNIELMFSEVSVGVRRRSLSRCLYHFIRQVDERFSWDFLHLVAVKCIFAEEEMIMFKKNCVYSSYKICTSLFIKKESEWAVMDRFLNFSFADAKEISNFKKSLAFNTVFEWYMPKESGFYDKIIIT